MPLRDTVDPRVARSRAAVAGAATTLFLQRGYDRTTMEAIAEAAGLTKRTLYNLYADKEALFTEIVQGMMAYAERFARSLQAEFTEARTEAAARRALRDLGRRMALAIVRPEVVALRRMLIGGSAAFPTLGVEYYRRAPGRVITALAAGLRGLGRAGLLDLRDPRLAAEQFAYLVVGAALDRAVVVGRVQAKAMVLRRASEGVETFLGRYGARAGRRPGRRAGASAH